MPRRERSRRTARGFAHEARDLAAIFALLALVLTVAPVAPAHAAEHSAAELQRLEAQGLRQIIVAREPGLSATARADVRADAGVAHVANMRVPDTEVVRAEPGRLVEAIRALEAEPGVRYAEPDAEAHVLTEEPDANALTTDPMWPALWALHNTGQSGGTPGADIGAQGAWALSTGLGQTLAVVDTGATFSHPDLQGAYGTNPGETGTDALGRDKATNHVDDDHDGYVDDARGWDFMNCSASCEDDGTPGPDSDPSDGDTTFNGHGTHVTGTIAARLNGVGVVGVARDAKVLPLRALGISGSGPISGIADAFALAGDLRVPIVNASLGGPWTQVLEDAIAAHPDTLYVVAAGNAATNDDAAPTYPCAYPEANIVCVGATDDTDAPASFSNYGATTVDLFAPGVGILSTVPGAGADVYAYDDGTSMATPHVAATLALMRARNPSLTASQLKARLLASVHPVDALHGLSVSGGRLDAAAAVAAAAPDPNDPDGDGVPTGSDDCPDVANPDQGDADRDGAGDACDATPYAASGATPVPPATTAGVGATAAPARTGPVTRAVPVLRAIKLGPGRLTARHPLTIRFTLDRAATAHITIRRRSGGAYRTVATVSVRAGRGANRYVLRTRIGSRTLRAGRYRVVVQAVSGSRRSTAGTVGLTVG